MTIDSYITVAQPSEHGVAVMVGAVCLRRELPQGSPDEERDSPESLGTILNRIISRIACSAYTLSFDNDCFQKALQTASLVASESQGAVELILCKREPLLLSFSHRIWRCIGGFDESLPSAEVLMDFATRIIGLRECTALEVC